MELGLYTFADVGTHPVSGEKIAPQQRLQNLLEEIELADQLGLDVFGIGEHHRPDYAVSSPAVVLAAAAVRTKKIRLSSAVTVLSSDDPVRVYQDFATVDLLSGGRAEIMAGRGSFIESFPLFGYNLQDYDTLFAEKLELLLQLNKSEHITWKGKQHTSPISNRGVYPRAVQKELPVWIAVGGTPESVVRAAQKGLPMALAIIGGQPARFAPLVQLYKDVYTKGGHPLDRMQVSINSHGYIAEESVQARNESFPTYAEVMSRIGKERGWPPTSRADFDAGAGPKGALLIGSPQKMIDEILHQHTLFGHTRFLVQMSLGALPHKQLMRAIELYGDKVAPEVRKHFGVQAH